MTQPDNQPLQTETLFSEPPTDYDAPPPPEPTGYPDEAYSDNPEPPPEEAGPDIHNDVLTSHPAMAGSPLGYHHAHKDVGVYLRALDTVESCTTRWLVNGWIPEGFVTLFTGREGIGKSTLIVDTVARFTRGELDGQGTNSLRNVLYVASEDDYRRVIVPRLKAAGAQMGRVFYPEAGEGDLYHPRFPRDLEILDGLIMGQGCALVVFDALLSFMPSDANTNDQKQVREFLEPLVQLANRRQVTIIGVTHLSSKKATTDSGAGMVGSSALSQTVRSVVTCARDDETGHLVAGVTKTNLAARGDSLTYRLESTTVALDDGGQVDVPRAVLLGPSDRPVEAFMTPTDCRDAKGSRDDLELLLLETLHDGEQPRTDLLEMATANGYSGSTFKRALQGLQKEGKVWSENKAIPGQPRRVVYRLACGEPVKGLETPVSE